MGSHDIYPFASNQVYILNFAFDLLIYLETRLNLPPMKPLI